MLLFMVSGALIGAVLGTQFTVVALIPAMMFALIIAVASTLTGGGAFGPTIIELALLSAGLQIGYLGGAGLRFALYRNIKRERTEQPSAERPLPRSHSR